MNLKDACISRDGTDEGTTLYTEIIEECSSAVDSGNPMDVEEILFDNGFEPDYIMDVLDALC